MAKSLTNHENAEGGIVGLEERGKDGQERGCNKY